MYRPHSSCEKPCRSMRRTASNSSTLRVTMASSCSSPTGRNSLVPGSLQTFSAFARSRQGHHLRCVLICFDASFSLLKTYVKNINDICRYKALDALCLRRAGLVSRQSPLLRSSRLAECVSLRARFRPAYCACVLPQDEVGGAGGPLRGGHGASGPPPARARRGRRGRRARSLPERSARAVPPRRAARTRRGRSPEAIGVSEMLDHVVIDERYALSDHVVRATLCVSHALEERSRGRRREGRDELLAALRG